MSSQQKTAEYFRNKSDEEIIEWMLKNLSTDQIKSCLDDDSPSLITPIEKGNITVDDLRKWCSNKKYVIEKIEENKVYFWYFLNKQKKWQYYIKPIENFPQTLGANAEECDPSDLLDEEQLNELKNYWNTDSLPEDEKAKFTNIMDQYEFDKNLVPKGYVFPDQVQDQDQDQAQAQDQDQAQDQVQDQDQDQDQVQDQDQAQDQVQDQDQAQDQDQVQDQAQDQDQDQDQEEQQEDNLSESLDKIQQAINFQKQTAVNPDSKLSGVINFSPVLIEGVDSNNVYYYYVIFNPVDQSILVKGNEDNSDVNNVSLDECKDKFMEILENFSTLEDLISTPGEGGGSQDITKSASSWKQDIKEVVNNFFTGKFANDLNTIKALYLTYPLTPLPNAEFFMSGLFSTSEFGKKCKYDNLNDLVKNHYGTKFYELFKTNINENKFGYKTLIYSK